VKFSRLHLWVTYLVAGLGFAALSLGRALNPLASVVIFIVFLLSAFIPPRLMRHPRWSQAWTVIVLTGLLVQILRGSFGEAILPLGIEYAALLQLSRLAYRRTAREHQQIAVIAFLHLIAATVLSSGVGYALIFLGFVIVLPWMLALTHLRSEIERHYTGAETGPTVERVLASRHVAGASFLLGTASLSVPLFAITAVFFLAFPRVGVGFLSLGRDTGRPVAGFGRNVQLGGFGRIRDDPTVVLRVRVPGSTNPPPARLELRMRGTSFDHYQSGEWTRSPGTTVAVHESYGFFPLSSVPQNETEQELSIVLDPLNEPVIFLPEGTIGISAPPRMVQGLAVARRIVRSDGADVRYMDSDGLEFNYTVHLSRRAPTAPLDPIDAVSFARYLELPSGQQRVVDLAREWTRGAEGPGAKAAALMHHLRDSGDYHYTLEQPDTRGRDPLAAFLLEAKAGHCEYFSTALAVMLRGVGVPARNVTGFLGAQYNRFGGYYAVRQGDAHSWVEAWMDDAWVTLDPTPPARDLLGPADDTLAGVRAFLDAVSMRWARNVVGYDLRRQAGALHDLMSFFSRFRRPDRSDDRPGSVTERSGQPEQHGESGVSGWLYLSGLLLLLLAMTLWIRRRVRRRVSLAPDRRAVVRLYRCLLIHI